MSIKRSTLPEISAHTIATWPRIRHDHSAGGVAYRRVVAQGDAGSTNSDTGSGTASHHTELIEVALIATRGGRRWQLPKGSREVNESPLQTAIREVHEEVGLHTVNEGFLKQIDYWYWDTYRKEVAELVHKSVDFYLLRVVGGILSDSSYEVDAVGSFTLDHALRILTFAGEREVVQMAQALLMGESGGAAENGSEESKIKKGDSHFRK